MILNLQNVPLNLQICFPHKLAATELKEIRSPYLPGHLCPPCYKLIKKSIGVQKLLRLSWMCARFIMTHTVVRILITNYFLVVTLCHHPSCLSHLVSAMIFNTSIQNLLHNWQRTIPIILCAPMFLLPVI